MQLLLFTDYTQREYLSLLHEYTYSPKLKLTGSLQYAHIFRSDTHQAFVFTLT